MPLAAMRGGREAEGYFVIHCLMVNSEHKGKGLALLLLDSCLPHWTAGALVEAYKRFGLSPVDDLEPDQGRV